MSVRGCVVDGCTILIDPAVRSLKGGRGMCNQHYYRWRRYGDPLGGKEPLRRKENLISIDGDVATVVLAHNRAVTLIDAADVDLIRPYSWCASTPARNGLRYATNTRMGRMHWLIMGTKMIDHIDGDGLNNLRSNLRVATVSQNGANQRSSRGKSRYKGVAAHPRANGTTKWAAQIGVRGKAVYLGIYVTEEEAAMAYDVAALQYHGEFALLNGVGRECE